MGLIGKSYRPRSDIGVSSGSTLFALNKGTIEHGINKNKQDTLLLGIDQAKEL